MSWRSSRWRSVVPALVLLASCSGSSDDAAEASEPPAASASATSPTVGPATSATSSAPATAPAPTATPVSTSAPTTASARVDGAAPEGFDRVAARIVAADGSTCDLCVWLAATPGQRAQGLMGVTDLSGADGMLFRWDDPTTGAFWMRDTPLPLSIAFFGADGSFVSSAEMAPCLDPVPDAECARYAAAGPYLHALEVAAGGLPALLIGPGSRLEVRPEPCPATAG